MTRDEVKRLLNVIALTYPQFRVMDKTATINAWYMCLAPYKAKDIEAAFLVYTRTSNTGFAPSPGQLCNSIPDKGVIPDVQSFEQELRKALSNGFYNYVDEFKKLSLLAQRVVGSATRLKEIAVMDSEAFEWEIRRLCKAYRSLKDYETSRVNRGDYTGIERKQETQAALPEEVEETVNERNVEKVHAMVQEALNKLWEKEMRSWE